MTPDPRTFDERRDKPHPCACGRHLHTGISHYCPWQPVRVVGRWGVIWAQAEHEVTE
jgi:hypothetical protein